MSSIREHPAVTDDGKPRRRLAFLASRGWIGIILAVLAFSAACFFILAPWQFSRNAERTAQNNSVDASAGYSAASLRSLDADAVLTIHVRNGYDDVTGIGSPNGPAFLTALGQ